IKKRINKDFSHSSISKALGDANEEYRKLATDKETKPLFEYSQNIKQDLSKSFNSEIKRMNAACGVANKLYSDLQAGTYNSDLEDIKKSVEEKFKTDLIPMSVVINDDGTWQSGQDYALNEQKKERGSWIEKVKNYIGEKRYNELYDEAFGFVKSVKKTKISAVNKEIYYFADSPENRLDQLLHDELEQRLLSASKESDKKRKPSKSQLRLPTDEEWEISELLNPGKSYLKFSLNENMVNKEIVQRLKKVTEELIQQSSYRLANTKFVHLLLVEDFRRTLGMSGNGDIVQERCFDGDGKLFNEATVLDVKKAIKGYEKLSLSSAKDMLDKIEHIKVMDNINHGDSYNYLKVDFIKDSLKTSPLVIADLLRLKHDYRYEELLCLYIKEINTAAENKILARKILFWSGMTASLAATVISGGSLGFTVPAMLATGISSAAMATDILFVASEGFEAWNLYTLKEEVRKNNSAYYDSVQSTIMSIDMLNEQKKAAIQNAFIMVAIGSVSPAVKLVKTLRGGVEITEKVAEDGSIIRKEIKKPYLDKKTGYITKTELTTIKTGEVLDKEVVKTTKVEKTVDAPQDYKRKTVYENTPTGTTRIKTKTIVERKVVNDLSNIEDNGVK
ncbi:MAG: hypothetical protein WCQ53_08820, partial [bacterium]